MYKLDLNLNQWIKLDCLGDKVLFLNRYSSMSGIILDALKFDLNMKALKLMIGAFLDWMVKIQGVFRTKPNPIFGHLFG